MSLQVWLPLTKDTRNQGLVNIVSSNNGVTFTNGGKLGEKYFSAGTITIPASSSNLIFNGTHMSFSFWLKPIGTSGTSVIFGQSNMSAGNNRMYSIFQYPTPNDLHISWQSETSSSTFIGFTISGFFEADKWTHCALVYDGSKLLVYKNGVLNGTYNGVNTRTAFNYDYPINASSIRCLNDFRIYDHCLSPMEVKKLAQGLVLHYPLNRNGWGQENLWLNSSCQNNLIGMSQSSNQFTITTKDGYQCAHLSGQLNTTSYLGMPSKLLPIAGEWYTISADIRIDNIVKGSTNPYVGIYFGGDYLTTDNTGSWYGGTSYSGDGKADNHTLINTYNNQGWHRVSCTVQYLHGGSEYQKGPFVLGYIYARDFTGDLYVKNIKFEKGKIATTWCPHKYDNLVLNGRYDYTIYEESDGSQWFRIAHHNNPANALFASTDSFVTGVYKDANRWYIVEPICNNISKWEFMVKQKPTSDGTESKYRWVQTKNPIVATHDDVSPSAVTRITTSGYTDGTYGGLYKSSTNRTRLTIADGVAGDWWGALGAWTDYSGGIPGYPKIKVTTGYIDLYIRIDNLSFDKTEYDISGFGNNATSFINQSYTTDTPKYVVSTVFQNGTAATISPIFSSTTRHKQLTFAAWIKRSSDDANYHYYWNNGGVRLGIRAYNNVNNYYWIAWTHATDSTYEDHGWVSTVMPKDTWIHVAWVFDSGIWKQYVNGVLNGTRNDSSYGIYVYGDVGSVLGNSWVGNLSDFRIYATALSADDVKSLYQNSATIDSNGIIHGQIRS